MFPSPLHFALEKKTTPLPRVKLFKPPVVRETIVSTGPSTGYSETILIIQKMFLPTGVG